MPPRALSVLPDSPLLDTPPLSPTSTSATRSSIASSNSSVSLGDLGPRMSKTPIGSRVLHETTEPRDPQGTSRKFVHDNTMFSGAREGDIEEELDGAMEQGIYQQDRGRSGYEDTYDQERASGPRPGMPRQGSYSKRHSSFDTPREVPFPYGYLTSSTTPLPGHSQHERSSSVPVCAQGSPVQRSSSRMDIDDDSSDGSASDSSPPRRPKLERSSTTSLPLPTLTSYSALPPLFSSTSPPRSDPAGAPPLVRHSSLDTGSGLESPMVPPPRLSSLKSPIPKPEPKPAIKSPSPPGSPGISRLPERMSSSSPPLLANESGAFDLARSNGSQPSMLQPSSQHDLRPHNSLPPPPKFSSFSSTSSPFPSTSSPFPRPTSLPHPIDNRSLALQSEGSGGSGGSGGSPFPPPEPPTVLTPPPPLTAAEEDARTPAPYEPFLPRDQPPPDHTYIAVETMATEYRLIVRLPGFQRDSITLAMRRRRILHVVADNWSDGGGHFERRISFGYDADLASVRAEFDGEILRIIVPRRAPPGWYTQPV